MTEQRKPDPVVAYSADEEAGLNRHEKMNNFVTSCGVIGCPICNYTGPEVPERQAEAGSETPEGGEQ